MSLPHDYRRLPSFRSMQVFEVAARHESFSAAADELGVTQGAVSRQVQELELALGRRMFVRNGPNLALTKTGETLAEQIRRAVGVLLAAVDIARSPSGGRHVTLSMLPSVATKWLAPRLGRFVEVHPDLDLRVSASRALVDFAVDGVDAAIRYGEGRWPGLSTELLAEELITPVCTPSYATRLGLRRPGDLLGAVLFHSDIVEDWRAWFRIAGVVAAPPRGPHIGDDAATLQAVLDGQGVALGRSVLVAEDVAAGRLITPFPQALRAAYSYWFVTPINAPAHADLMTVRAWLTDEFAKCRPPA